MIETMCVLGKNDDAITYPKTYIKLHNCLKSFVRHLYILKTIFMAVLRNDDFQYF